MISILKNFIFAQLPSINARKKGKYTEDPIKNLPQLPEKRVKQAWNDPQNFNQFEVGAKENETGQSSFDLIREINARTTLHTLFSFASLFTLFKLNCFFFIK